MAKDRPVSEYFTNSQIAIMAAFALLTVGAGGAGLLFKKADADDLKRVEIRMDNLEQHHVADDVRITNIERSVQWQQDTLFRTADRMGVMNVQPPPTPLKVPTVLPIVVPSPSQTKGP